MKKVILALLVAISLSAQSEEFYKAKYEYLMQKLKKADRECIDASIATLKTDSPYDRYSKHDEERDEDKADKSCAISDDVKDKIMELRFQAIEDLKVKPDWFAFGDKK